MPEKAQKTGVILLNMGAPSTMEEIRPYLRRLFLDPMLIQLPAGFLYRRLLANFVSRKRAARVRARYEKIGGGSPLLNNTRMQAEALARQLEMPVAIAMRYSAPYAAEAVEHLLDQGVEQAVALPLYPQFSSSTTGSSLVDLQQAAGRLELTIVDRHFDHPQYVGAIATALTDRLSGSDRSSHVLFTAHSIPVKYTRQGDPYIAEVKATASAVAQAASLTTPWSLGFQSAASVGTWHGPFIEEELGRLAQAEIQRLVVCPLTFAADNLETLYDLDIVFAGECMAAGITDVVRVPAPGASPEYIGALSSMVQEALST